MTELAGAEGGGQGEGQLHVRTAGQRTLFERLKGQAGRRCHPEGVCDRSTERGQGMLDDVIVKTKLMILLFLVANKINGVPTGGGGGSSQKTPLFETYSDWDREIKRTGASGWRVCSINEGYMISTW